MKKLILTSVALVLFSLISYGQDNGKCQKKCGGQVAQSGCNGNGSTASIYSLTDFSQTAKTPGCKGSEAQKCGEASSQKCSSVSNSQKCCGAATQKSSVAETKKASAVKGQNRSIAKL